MSYSLFQGSFQGVEIFGRGQKEKGWIRYESLRVTGFERLDESVSKGIGTEITKLLALYLSTVNLVEIQLKLKCIKFIGLFHRLSSAIKGLFKKNYLLFKKNYVF